MAAPSGRLPGSVWDPIRLRSRLSNRVVRVTIHTAWSSSSDIYGPGKGPGGTYAHFYNPSAGKIRQHQLMHRKAYADLEGNGSTIAIEHEDGRRAVPLTDSQIENAAQVFAYAVNNYGVPNRIATWNDTRGLAWHRLGIKGNFGKFDRNNILTWCGYQTGIRFSTAFGKTCPTDPRILQIREIWNRAQKYITGKAALPNIPQEKKEPKRKGNDRRRGPSGQGAASTKSIQKVLKRCGYYSGVIDGDYGPVTVGAVKDYQATQNENGNAGLLVDGDYGSITRSWLIWTKALQRALPAYKGISKLRVDGDYGSVTEKAVRTLQARNGLYVDGVAGPKTIAFMRACGSSIPDRP